MDTNDKLVKIIEYKKLKGSIRKPKYATRKLSIGLVSCMLGYALLVSPSSVEASAETTDVVVEEKATSPEDNPVDESSDVTDETKEKPVTYNEENLEDVLPVNDILEGDKTEETPADVKEEFKLTEEEKARLIEADFTEAEIEEIEKEAKEKKEANKNFDLESFLDKKIADKKLADEEAKKAGEVSNAKDDKAIEIKNKYTDGETARNNTVDTFKHTIWGTTFEDLGGNIPHFDGNNKTTAATGEQQEKEALEKSKMNSHDKLIGNMPLFFQWMDRDGSLSPIYKFKSNDNGYFAIDPGEFTTTSPNGVEVKHRFMGKQLETVLTSAFKYRIWADQTWLEENNYNAGNTPNGNFGQWGGYAKGISGAETSIMQDVATMAIQNAYVNVQRKDDLSQHAPKEERIVQDPIAEDINHNDGKAKSLRGNVYWENSYKPDALYAYPKMEDKKGDLYAEDMTVILTIVNKADNKKITYETKTNKFGDFQFDLSDAPDRLGIPSGKKNKMKFFQQTLINISIADKDGNVLDKETNVWSNSTLGGIFANGGSNSTINGGSLDYSAGFRDDNSGAKLYSYDDNVLNNDIYRGTGFQFILRRISPVIDITNYDSEVQKAKAGDTATATVTGVYPNQKYVVKWYEVQEKTENAPVLKKTGEEFTVGADGSFPQQTFDVPADLNRNTNYIVQLETLDGNIVSIDTFTAIPETLADKVEPKYTDADAEAGKPTTITAPNFTDKDGKETTKPEGTKFALGEGAPAGAKINEETGEITYTPTEADAGKEIDIPVVVTYPDKSTDEVSATIKVAEQDTTAPTITPIDDKTVTEKKPIEEITVETDDENAEVTVEGLPDGVTYDKETGKITGTPEVTDWGKEEETRDFEVTVKAKDEAGNESEETFKITVQRDTDGDGEPDVTDTDDDNDGVTDEDEKEAGTDPKDPDSKPETDKTTVDQSGKKPVDPTDEKQDTGVKVENKDDDTNISAKDEDGKDVPVEIDEDGKVIVTPGEDVDGPITVTVEDPELPDGKVDVEVEVNGHEKDKDDNGSETPEDKKTSVDTTGKKPVDPTDEKQDTGVKVENPDEDTKVSAKDEDGKDVPVEIDEDGKVIVTPGEDVDGPITVTVEDPELPDGKVDVEVEVNGHEKDKDDNGSDTEDKTSVDTTGKKPVDPTDEKQDTGVKVENPDKDTKVTAKDEDGNDVPAEINPETGEVEVTPGENVDGPIKVVVEDPELPDGKVDVEVEVNGHEKDKDDNGSDTEDKTSVDTTGKKPVDPTDEKQDTGVKVENPDKDTKVTAKDEDGNDVPAEINPETGEVEVTPGKKVDGPITVTVEDPDLPGGKVEVEVPVNGHEKGKDDNGSDKEDKTTVDDSNVKPVDPTDEKQGTGVKVENPDKDTKVTAKDEDGNDVPAEINPETGEVEVTPGKKVDGPITVTVEDPELPDGKVDVEVEVNGHEKDKDDNGSDTEDKTSVDTTGKKPVDPTDEKQGTGVKVENPDKDTKVTAKDEDGNEIPAVINPETGEVEVTPGENVDGPIKVVVEDPDLPGGKVEVEVPVNGHEKGKDDNNSDKTPSNPGTNPGGDTKPGKDDNKPSDNDDNKPGKKKTDAEENPAQDPKKTEVEDKDNLTEEEKDKVEEEVKKANPKAKDVDVDNKGNATLTYPDGSKNHISSDKTVTEKEKSTKDNTDAENNPAVVPSEKTGVVDKDNLTDAERREVADKVNKANPNAKEVIVDAQGNATLIYPDGSRNFIAASDLIYEKAKEVVAEKAVQTTNKTGKSSNTNVKTGVESLTGVMATLATAVGGLFVSKKRKDDDR